jgi:hypothetical protein
MQRYLRLNYRGLETRGNNSHHNHLIMEDLMKVEDLSEDLNCCLFAVSKMYVCTTNESCPYLRSRFGTMAIPPKSVC